MVRIRQRYILCKLLHKSGNKFRISGVTQHEILEAVRKKIEELFGVYALAVCRDITIRYFHPVSGTVIFRVAPEGKDYFGSALPTVKFGDFHFVIRQIAGTGRTVTKRLIQLFRRDVIEAATLFSAQEREEFKRNLSEEITKVESGESAISY